MLVLSRKTNQNIIIDGRIVVKVVRLVGRVVKLGIDAPLSVPVHRQEVFEEIEQGLRPAGPRRPSSEERRLPPRRRPGPPRPVHDYEPAAAGHTHTPVPEPATHR
jgi:carbon storage regulator